MSARRRCGALALAAVLAAGGCTSFKTVELPPGTLKEEIVAGNVVKPGDRIRVTRRVGEPVSFRVTGIRDGLLLGEGVSVAIEEIEALESREYSAGKTVALVGGISAATVALMLVALSSVAFMM